MLHCKRHARRNQPLLRILDDRADRHVKYRRVPSTKAKGHHNRTPLALRWRVGSRYRAVNRKFIMRRIMWGRMK